MLNRNSCYEPKHCAIALLTNKSDGVFVCWRLCILDDKGEIHYLYLLKELDATCAGETVLGKVIQ